MSAAAETPVVASGYDNASVTKKITDVVLTRPMHNGWIFGFAFAFLLLMMFLFCIAWLFLKGVGIWGINIPVAWGFAITNFVWWIGIGHAGTFISAILLLLHQDWRTSINRFAEAMTLSPSPAREHFRCCIWAGRGFSTGFCRIPTRWDSGRNGAARSSGTYSRSALICSSRSSFGTSASCRIWRRCAIARRANQCSSSTASSPSAGAARRGIGNAFTWCICSSPDWRRRSCSPCTAWSHSISRSRWSRLAFHHLPALLRGGSNLSPVLPWC